MINSTLIKLKERVLNSKVGQLFWKLEHLVSSKPENQEFMQNFDVGFNNLRVIYFVQINYESRVLILQILLQLELVQRFEGQ